jgi:hypothetical protein
LLLLLSVAIAIAVASAITFANYLRRFRHRRHSRESGNPGRTLRRAAPHPLNLQPFGLKVTNWIPAFAGMTGAASE